jgi:hypothetical protein
MTVYFITANDTPFGEYQAANADEALLAYAKDAGYRSYAEMDEVSGGSNDIEVLEIDTAAIVAAVEAVSKGPVMQDSYGGGVALVDGISYASYDDLAAAIGKRCWDFSA